MLSLYIHAHWPVVSAIDVAADVYAAPVEKLMLDVVGVIVAVPAPMSHATTIKLDPNPAEAADGNVTAMAPALLNET